MNPGGQPAQTLRRDGGASPVGAVLEVRGVGDLPDVEVINSVPLVLQEVVRDLQERDEKSAPAITAGGKEHGRLRCKQGFQLLQLVEEIRILRNLVYQTIQENLLIIEVSALIPDMVRISDSLDARLRESVWAFLEISNPEMLQKTA